MTGLIVAFIVLGFLILIHELGHFLVAKACGVRVEAFSIGFGKPLLKWKKGDTEYRLSMLPLGGYVKMAGENPDEEITGSPDEFASQPVYKKILIIAAGPAMNIALGVVLIYIMFVSGIQVPGFYKETPVIYRIEKGSVAEGLGLREGDRIVAVNGQKVKTWKGFYRLLDKAGNSFTLKVVRPDGDELEYKISLKNDQSLGLLPYLPSKIGGVVSLYPAEKAGLKQGDEIVEIDGQKVESWYDVSEYIKSRAGQKINLKVKRGKTGKLISVDLWVEKVKIEGQEFGMIGIQPVSDIEKFGPVKSIKYTFYTTLDMSLAVFYTIRQLLTGGISANLVSGPLGIIYMTKSQVQKGVHSLIRFVALLTINLGVINLLPIPVVDGGELITYIAEGVTRRKISEKYRILLQQLGFAIIILLFLFAMYSDIIKFVSFRR